jgi:hypothetical protein
MRYFLKKVTENIYLFFVTLLQFKRYNTYMKKRLILVLEMVEYDDIRDEILLMLQKFYAEDLLIELDKIHYSYNYQNMYTHINSDNFASVCEILESMIH